MIADEGRKEGIRVEEMDGLVWDGYYFVVAGV